MKDDPIVATVAVAGAQGAAWNVLTGTHRETRQKGTQNRSVIGLYNP